MAGDSEEEDGTKTSKESSLTSSDGIGDRPPPKKPLNSDIDSAPLAIGLSMIQSKQHELSSMHSNPAFGTHQSISPAELLQLQTREFHHHSTLPQHNVTVPVIKPTVMLNPNEAAATNNSSCYDHTSNVSPSEPLVPTETFPPPSFTSQLVDKQDLYQQMSSLNSYGPQQAEAYHNFLNPTMPNPQVSHHEYHQSPRRPSPTLQQILNWFAQNQGIGNQQSTRINTTRINTPRNDTDITTNTNANTNTNTNTNTARVRRCTNLVYDPKYEEMGLPIDPHLRYFLASVNQTNAEAGSKTNSQN